MASEPPCRDYLPVTVIMTRIFSGAALSAVIFVLTALPVQSAMAYTSTSDRLDNIERKLDARGLQDMLNRMDQLQQDLQELRGELEVQTHTLKNLQRRQREQYLDIDRRLQQLENPSVGGPPGAANTFTPMTAAPVKVPPLTRPPAQKPAPAKPPAALVPGSIEQIGEQAEYDTAFAVLREGRYTEATQAFKKFLADHPGSTYADNANYWLGEAYYVTRNFDKALRAFQGLVNTYPQSTKVPGSRLKIAYIHYEKKDWPAARKALSALVSDYPDTTVSRQANERLQRMKKEGN
jgi:tol-pal system protein YbgF